MIVCLAILMMCCLIKIYIMQKQINELTGVLRQLARAMDRQLDCNRNMLTLLEIHIKHCEKEKKS